MNEEMADMKHSDREITNGSHSSCTGKVVRYVVVPLVLIAVVANMKDVYRYLKLVAM